MTKNNELGGPGRTACGVDPVDKERAPARANDHGPSGWRSSQKAPWDAYGRVARRLSTGSLWTGRPEAIDGKPMDGMPGGYRRGSRWTPMDGTPGGVSKGSLWTPMDGTPTDGTRMDAPYECGRRAGPRSVGLVEPAEQREFAIVSSPWACRNNKASLRQTLTERSSGVKRFDQATEMVAGAIFGLRA